MVTTDDTPDDDRATADALPTPRDRLDTEVVHSARRYNYWLGGKDNFAADRASGDAIAAVYPNIRKAAIENRRFLQRVVKFLVHEQGIRQFLDIGTGLPTADNTHEVAQRLAPESRIVYADNDPLVLVHARALLTSAPEGATAYLDADLRQPETILKHDDLHATLDLSQPVGLLLIAILQFIDDRDDPHGIVRQLLDALPAGSYLAISHPTFDGIPTDVVDQLTTLSNTPGGEFHPRSLDEVARFFDGTHLVDPGLGSIVHWRPRHEPRPTLSAKATAVYGAVGRIP